MQKAGVRDRGRKPWFCLWRLPRPHFQKSARISLFSACLQVLFLTHMFQLLLVGMPVGISACPSGKVLRH